MKKNAVVVIGGGITSLGIIRNIGRSGIDVICIIEEKDFSCKSRYISSVVVNPKLSSEPNSIFDSLRIIDETYTYDKFILYPISDQSVHTISLNIDKLKPNFLVNIPCIESIDSLIDKGKFYSLLKKLKIPHPKSVSVNDLADVESASNFLDFPFFLKPNKSHEFRAKFDGKKGFTINSQDELKEKVQLASQNSIEVMLNEIIPGKSSSHFFIDGYYDQNGHLKAVFTRRRIHMHPLDWGNSTSMVSIEPEQIQPALNDLTRLLNHLEYRGIFSAEIKHDHRDNLYKFIEINARSWWYNMFPSHCGTNIIKMAYDDLTNKKIERDDSFIQNKYHIYVWPEIKSMIQMIKQKEKKFVDILKEVKFPVTSPLFAFDDLLPFIWRFFGRISQFIYPRN